MNKRMRFLEWAISFWVGVGLMSIINIWKISQNRQPLLYSWIMFSISIIFIFICGIYLIVKNKKQRSS